MIQLCFVKGNFIEGRSGKSAYEKLDDMSVTNSITTHMEQMYYELKDDQHLWKDWDDYVNSCVNVQSFKKNWKSNQATYSIGFRDYINDKL